MARIRHVIDAPCAPQRIWEVLADLEAVQHYNPTVAGVRIRGERSEGVGAERECDLRPNGKVVERVTAWEEGAALGIEVVESDWPIHFMRWTTRVAPHDGGSRITQDLEYQVKFGPLGYVLDQLVMKRKLVTTLDTVFANLIARATSC